MIEYKNTMHSVTICSTFNIGPVISALHQAAKETIAKAEEMFVHHHDNRHFDSTWQEVLNRAIIKVLYSIYFNLAIYSVFNPTEDALISFQVMCP